MGPDQVDIPSGEPRRGGRPFRELCLGGYSWAHWAASVLADARFSTILQVGDPHPRSAMDDDLHRADRLLPPVRAVLYVDLLELQAGSRNNVTVAVVPFVNDREAAVS